MTSHDAEQDAAPTEGTVIVTGGGSGTFTQQITAGHQQFLADEPQPAGDDAGPTPYDLLLAALGSCKSMTVRMYADRKGWPLDRVRVTLRHSRIHAKDCADCETKSGWIRPDCCRCGTVRRTRRQSAPTVDAHRRTVPGASGVDVGDSHRHIVAIAPAHPGEASTSSLVGEKTCARQPFVDVATRVLCFLAAHGEALTDRCSAAEPGVVLNRAAHATDGIGDERKDRLTPQVDLVGEGRA